jgi:hypothetical protein
MFLHIMVGQNPKKLNAKKTIYFISYDVMLEYICAKQIYVPMYKKMQICSKKILKLFMKFVISTKHCDSIWLE